ncbi:hypothetical protein [Paraclostridium dentum]|uniref:hypothetical protein n=1 Tax=Paraclostridium dentum TaxID=2662455 RepID=UPI003F2D347C
MICKRKTPIYEEIDTELEKLILDSYKNGTLVIDSIIHPKINNIEYTSSTSGTIDSISSEKIPAIKKEIEKINSMNYSNADILTPVKQPIKDGLIC